MSVTAPEQGTPPQDPQVTPDPTPAAPVAAAPAAPISAGDGPWASDLATLFTDEATRGQVDQFLRAKVQPYTTQLEQKASQAEDALRLWGDLSESPVDTYVAITHEMFGEEAAQSLLATLQQQVGTEQPPQGTPAQQAQSDPRLESVLQWVENQQSGQQYDNELARVTTAHPEIDTDLFHPFVAAADGNFDEAYNLYTNWLSTYGEKYGASPAPAVPPPVAGSDTGGAAQPSSAAIEPRKQTLDEALNDFMAEQRAARQAPPVAG